MTVSQWIGAAMLIVPMIIILGFAAVETIGAAIEQRNFFGVAMFGLLFWLIAALVLVEMGK